MPVPRLRSLDFIATEWRGQRVICVRDHEGLLGAPVFLPLPVVTVAMLLDGRREVRDVQVEYLRLTGGILLPSWDIDRIIHDLDAHALLESPRLEARRREVAAAYRAAPYRRMAHADLSYPADPQALAEALDGYLQAAEGASGSVTPASAGPGVPQDEAARLGTPGRSGAGVYVGTTASVSPRGVLAPHIDFVRGGPSYGHAYRVLRHLPEGTCVVVLGVAHAGRSAPYVLTAKGYETPFGVLEVDRPLLDAVCARCPFDAFADEPVHVNEHSIEFQALFLAHLTRGRRITILPVLCGNLEALCGGRSPVHVDEVERFIDALRGAIAALGRPVCVVGGVDLSHVGPRFGDGDPVGLALAARTRAFDLGALAYVESGDAEGFWHTVAADGNSHHVCGLGAIYTVVRVLAPVRGQVLNYGQGLDPAGGLVGFAAAALE